MTKFSTLIEKQLSVYDPGRGKEQFSFPQPPGDGITKILKARGLKQGIDWGWTAPTVLNIAPDVLDTEILKMVQHYGGIGRLVNIPLLELPKFYKKYRQTTLTEGLMDKLKKLSGVGDAELKAAQEEQSPGSTKGFGRLASAIERIPLLGKGRQLRKSVAAKKEADIKAKKEADAKTEEQRIKEIKEIDVAVPKLKEVLTLIGKEECQKNGKLLLANAEIQTFFLETIEAISTYYIKALWSNEGRAIVAKMEERDKEKNAEKLKKLKEEIQTDTDKIMKDAEKISDSAKNSMEQLISRISALGIVSPTFVFKKNELSQLQKVLQNENLRYSTEHQDIYYIMQKYFGFFANGLDMITPVLKKKDPKLAKAFEKDIIEEYNKFVIELQRLLDNKIQLQQASTTVKKAPKLNIKQPPATP